MATVSTNKIAEAIYLALKDKNATEQKNTFRSVVEFLSRKRLLAKSSEILAHLGKIINKEKGVTLVKVYSAQKLEHKAKAHIVDNLKHRYSSKDIVLEEVLDEKLLGGMRLEIDDEVIDLTLKNKINKLQEYLIK